MWITWWCAFLWNDSDRPAALWYLMEALELLWHRNQAKSSRLSISKVYRFCQKEALRLPFGKRSGAATKSHRRDLKRCRIMLKQVDLIQVSSFFPSRTLLMAFVASVRALGLTAAPCSNSGWSWANTSEVVATLLLSVSNLTGTGHMTLYSVLAPQYSHLWCWLWMNSVPTNAWLKDLYSDLAPKWLRQAAQWANCLEVRGVLLGCRELMITTSIREMYGSILFQGRFQRSLKQRAPERLQ